MNGYKQTVQKILFHPFRKAQNTRKVIETSNKPVFKDKILIVWRGRIISKRTSDTNLGYFGANLFRECEYFHKTKMVPTYKYRMYLYHHFRQITLEIQVVFKLPQKPHKILKRAIVATRLTPRQPGSIQQTVQYSCTAIHCEHCLKYWKPM